MITVSNYDQKKSSVKWNDLPSAVRKNRDDVEGMLELYGEDEDIDKVIDTFLKQLNKSPGKVPAKKQTVQAKINDSQVKNQSVTTKGKHKVWRSENGLYVDGDFVDASNHKLQDKALQNVDDGDFYINGFTDEEGKQTGGEINMDRVDVNVPGIPGVKYRLTDNKEGELISKLIMAMKAEGFEIVHNKTQPKKKAAPKKVKKVVDYKIVDNFSEEFKLLRRFLNLTKKELLSFQQIRLMYMAFNKAAVSRTIRKSSDKADEFELANNGITKMYDQAEKWDEPKDNEYELNIENKKLIKDLTAYVAGTKINYAITLLRSFISFQGTIPGKEKATRLLKRFTNAIKSERVDDKNRLYDKILDAKEELEEYLKTPNEKVDVESFGLSAPRGICTNRIKCEGLNDKGQLKKGYRFLNGGTVVKSKKKGLSKPAKKKI